MWSVYILRCRDNSFYVGITANLKERIKEHNSGEGSLYTKNKRPVKLIYLEKYSNLELAMRRERQIKGWRRKKKENLVRFGHPLTGE